jgi:hypothetical protein
LRPQKTGFKKSSREREFFSPREAANTKKTRVVVLLSLLLQKKHTQKKNEYSRATRPVALSGKLDDGILFFRRIIDKFLRVESAVLSLFLLFLCLFFFFFFFSSSLRVRTTRTKIQQQQQQSIMAHHHHHRRSRFFQIWVIDETRQ